MSSSASRKRFKLCLAASGGGHLRQILDLQPYWKDKDFFILTEDTALSRGLNKDWKIRYVPHFAFGQAKLSGVFSIIVSSCRNLIKTVQILADEAPTHVITTGAGSVFFTVIIARLFGAKIVLVESFARFNKPSLFFKLSSPFAQCQVVQAEPLQAFWPKAHLFDPVSIFEDGSIQKKPLLFATVGATLPFERLVNAVVSSKASGLIPEEVIIQTGGAEVVAEGITSLATVTYDEMKAIHKDADLVVCHAGTGSIITGLQHGCRVIVMPRQATAGEHYDAHQNDITDAFRIRGLISVAKTEADLPAALDEARKRTPIFVRTDYTRLIEFLRTHWRELEAV
jgi:UDP-N-acetylglucosamine transferase subunit ALG13